MTKKEITQIKSIRERILLDLYLKTISNIIDIEYTDYLSQIKHDATCTLIQEEGEASVIIEAKTRTKLSTAFPDWLIEKDKYDYLINQNYDYILYINFFEDATIIFDLKTIQEPKWVMRTLQQDDTSNGENTIEKEIAYLPTTQGQIIKQENNIWSAYDQAHNIFKTRHK